MTSEEIAVEAPEKKTTLWAAAGWLFSLARSPWVLFTIPITVGGLWLVLHPEIILSNLDKPYMLLAGPAFVGSIVLVWVVFTFFKAIAALCRKIWNSFCVWYAKPGSMFWIIINIFLLVSISESGNYFNGLLGSNDMYGVLGYAVAFVIDLVAIQSMQARLGASRMRDKAGERLYQLGVFACAGLSAWANTYAALEHFQAPVGATHLPEIMITIAPWTGMAFPLLIIFLSFTADYTADQTSSRLDPEKFKEAEDNRNKLIKYQRDSLLERQVYLADIDRANGKIIVQKVEREFFLLRRFFPGKQPNVQVAPALDYVALMDLLKPHLEEIKSSLAVDLKPAIPTIDYVALALAVAPHIEARSTTQVALSPVVPDLTQVALAKNQVDLSPVVPASSPVDLALTQVASSPLAPASSPLASSPVPPKEPGPVPDLQVQSGGSQVASMGGSELKWGGSAGSEAGTSGSEATKSSQVASKSGNEERDRKLAAAYEAMVAEGAAISGRTLAGRAKCARPAATEWLRLLFQVAPGGSESSSGPEATGPGSDMSGSEDDISGSGSDRVDLKPRSRNTDELVALDLEVAL